MFSKPFGNWRSSVVALATASLAAIPAVAQAADASGAHVVVRADTARSISDLLVAAEGKLVVRHSIPAIKATIFAGKGEWAQLSSRELADAVRALARKNHVALGYVEADEVSRAAGDCCVELRLPKEKAELERMMAKLRWPHRALGLQGRATDAKGTVVAILDTGVDQDHALLKSALVEGESLQESETDLQDRNGHGTAMAGVIAAQGDEHDPVGIAKNARVLPIKVMDERGTGDVATLARGIVRAVDRGARVILVSAGVAAPSKMLEDAIRYARSKDAIVVAAAGNEPLGRALYPASTPGALAVTSSRENGKLSLACALDPIAELAAPGDEIHTTLPRNLMGGQAVLSGTSFSAAFVAGVAALGIGKGHTSDEVLRALRGARREIPALAGAERFMPTGELDAALALARLEQADRSLEAVWALPSVVRPGSTLRVKARVRNAGGRSVAPGTLSVLAGDRALATIALPQLPSDGAAVEVEAPVEVPATLGGASVTLTVRLSADEDASDDARTLTLPVVARDAAQVAKLAIVGMAVDDERGTLAVTVENQGEVAESSVVVGAQADGENLAVVTPLTQIARGAQGVARFALPARTTESPVALVAGVKGRAGTISGRLDVRLAGKDPRPVRPQYQQSNDVDVIADAPWRLEPNRAYVPVMVFVPSKGDAGNGIDVTVDSAKVTALDDASATSGTTLYDYTNGQPATAATNTSIIDENGQDTGSVQLFQDQTLTENGHHEIFRFARDAFGVAAQPTAPVDKFIDVKIHYTAHRHGFWGGIDVDTGDYHKVMRVTFDARPLPVLPGDGHYYDTHCHTIAEWYFSSKLDLLAPRKAYGGPIVMIRECAYALGLTDSAQPAPGSIITTDHSCFFNNEDPDANDGKRRIQVGPTAPQNSKDASGNVEDQLTRYHELFGATANEELAFHQDQNYSIGPVSLGIPLGAHMLAFRAGHWEERWNAEDGGASPNQRQFGHGTLTLDEVLGAAAKKAPTQFRDAFFYSAHAWGGQGWSPASLDDGLELTPNANGTRDGRFMNDATDNFVLKGHQLWNRREGRSLPTSKIDWSNINPWSDPTFVKGESAWSRGLETGLLAYQTEISQLLRYSRSSEPGRTFPRKVYIAAGSDAHGDFNYEEGRLATPIPLASTWSICDSAFGKARTYVLEDGVQGAADGTRALNALAAGRSVVTDGPLARFTLDTNAHFDAAHLVYHAGQASYEDADGQIGGGGNGPDGANTALVVAGSQDALLSYRYEDAPQAAVQALELYRAEAGQAPKSRKVHDADSNSDYDAPAPALTLPTTAASTDLTASAGSFDKLAAIQLAAFAGGDPAQGALPADAKRCYTNPIWVAPVQVEWANRSFDAKAGKFAPGGLRLRFHFPLSMTPTACQVEIKPVDAQGNTTDGSVAGQVLAPVSGTGWSTDATTGVVNGVYEVANTNEISLAQQDYPTAGTATFAVYFRDVPQDSFGNALNRIALTFTAPRIGTPSTTTGTGSGTTTGSGSGSVAPVGSTVAGSTASTSGYVGGFQSGGHGSGGCMVATGSSNDARTILPLLAVAGLLVVSRRRRAARAA